MSGKGGQGQPLREVEVPATYAGDLDARLAELTEAFHARTDVCNQSISAFVKATPGRVVFEMLVPASDYAEAFAIAGHAVGQVLAEAGGNPEDWDVGKPCMPPPF